MDYVVVLAKSGPLLKVKYTGEVTPGVKKRVAAYLKRIENLHELPKDKVYIHVVPTKELKEEGVKAKFDSDKKLFIIDPKAHSFQHEFGHYIDRFVLGQEGKPWSESSANYRSAFGFKKRPRDREGHTQYYDPMRGVRGWYTPKTKRDSDTTIEYARSQPKEHFASAYNKLLGEQDGSKHAIDSQALKKYKKILLRKLVSAGVKIKELAKGS